MDAFARWLTRHPLAVVVANLAVTAVLGLYALHIRIENSLESMLPAGDPKVAYYNTTRALFGPRETISLSAATSRAGAAVRIEPQQIATGDAATLSLQGIGANVAVIVTAQSPSTVKTLGKSWTLRFLPE